jgi:YD repeat-containing protein
VPDFVGDIEKITERRFGKELNLVKGDSGVFKPKMFSGWEYVYLFENARLVRRTNTIKGVLDADYVYQREAVGNRRIEREIIQDSLKNQKGDYIEYENFLNEEGQIEKVNFWSFSANDSSRVLFLVEMNARYVNGLLLNYTRHSVNDSGELDRGEKCSLTYDNLGRLIRMERQDVATNFKTILYYDYNRRGRVSRFSIDYLVGLRNDQNTQRQIINYKYDRRGNWNKRYWISDKNRRLEDKRKIRYI